MSLVQIPLGSDEWEVAFFHSIQSKVMMRLDEIKPGYVTNIYEDLGEDTVFILFKEACQHSGYEISRDNNNDHWLIKTPMADLSSSNIYTLLSKYKDNKGYSDDEIYNLNGSNSHFKMISQNFLKSSLATFKKNSFESSSEAHWEFPDKSCIKIGDYGLKTWNTDAKISEEDFESFVSSYKTLLDKGLIKETTSDFSMV
jgi:hypothetical protein